MGFSLSEKMTFCHGKNKKTDVAEYLEEFRHVGLL
jgi:hypothetical protein